MQHESIPAGRSEHMHGKNRTFSPYRRNDMEPDFLPVDENAWLKDFQPQFDESNEPPTSQTSTVDVQTKLFQRQHQFLFELKPSNAALKLPKYLSVSRPDSENGYGLQFHNADPRKEESGESKSNAFRNAQVLEAMRRANSSEKALFELRQHFRKKGIDLFRVNA